MFHKGKNYNPNHQGEKVPSFVCELKLLNPLTPPPLDKKIQQEVTTSFGLVSHYFKVPSKEIPSVASIETLFTSISFN